MKPKHSKKAKRHGRYRSGLEAKIAADLDNHGVYVKYETHKISYTKPVTCHTYTPDFVLPNGIIIEAKGLFSSTDRKKHMFVKEQHPNLDIRFVFGNSQNKLYRGSPTTYAGWCLKKGFLYADRLIPVNWIEEKRK
jgi:hypothetical protein|tara:strand:- start:1436 stop:1843 length:408 start_codon:yes stop_codon:yes gene_type:complete